MRPDDARSAVNELLADRSPLIRLGREAREETDRDLPRGSTEVESDVLWSQ